MGFFGNLGDAFSEAGGVLRMRISSNNKKDEVNKNG